MGYLYKSGNRYGGLTTLNVCPVEHRTLLWTNPDLTANFAAQTVELDLSDYDEVEIEFVLWTGDPRSCCIRRGSKGEECIASTIASNSTKGNTGNTFASTIINQMRAFTANDTGVTFSQAVEATAGANFGVQNHSLLPYQIYGIKRQNTHMELEQLGIHVSTKEPTVNDGQDGDIWFVYF